jgi:CheY-like chemotaxis protein
MNFLIVEDNDRMRSMLRSIVAELAGETHECSDGSTALAAYAEHLPDWVLMDVKMKDVDGITATRQIRSSFPQAKIMIVSDHDDLELRLAAHQAGASEYVAKESLYDLCRILRAWAAAEVETGFKSSTGNPARANSDEVA